MIRYLILFLVALAGVAGGAFIEGAAFLTPLSLALLLFGVLALWHLDQRPIRSLGFPDGARWPLQLVGSLLIGAGVMAFLTWTLSWSGQLSISAGEVDVGDLPRAIFFTFVFTALIAATEELIFRGGYYELIKHRYSIWIGILASAALWAVFHLPGMAADQVPAEGLIYGFLTFLGFGVFLGLTKAIAGGSLWVPIGIHYGYNLGYSFLGAFFSVELIGQSLLMGYSGWVPETGLFSAMVWLGLALLLGLRGRQWVQTARDRE